MFSKQHNFIRMVLSAFALFICSPAANAQSADQKARAIIGTWLISKASYDHWMDAGFINNNIPILMIRKDGTFSLFRLQASCEILGKNGRLILPLRDNGGLTRVCLRNAQAAKSLGLGPHFAVSVEGVWSVDASGKVHFQPKKTGRVSRNFSVRLKEHLADVPGYIRELKKEVSRPKVVQRVRADLSLHRERIRRFTTTFFIMDGKPASYAVKRDVLTLTGAGGRWRLDYRRDDKLHAVGAFFLLKGLQINANQYFRCFTDRLRNAASGGSTTDRSLISLTLLVRRTVERSFDQQRLQVKMQKVATEANKNRLSELKIARKKDLDALRKHPAYRIYEEDLGRFSECPDRGRYP